MKGWAHVSTRVKWMHVLRPRGWRGGLGGGYMKTDSGQERVAAGRRWRRKRGTKQIKRESTREEKKTEINKWRKDERRNTIFFKKTEENRNITINRRRKYKQRLTQIKKNMNKIEVLTFFQEDRVSGAPPSGVTLNFLICYELLLMCLNCCISNHVDFTPSLSTKLCSI